MNPYLDTADHRTCENPKCRRKFSVASARSQQRFCSTPCRFYPTPQQSTGPVSAEARFHRTVMRFVREAIA